MTTAKNPNGNGYLYYRPLTMHFVAVRNDGWLRIQIQLWNT